MKRWFRWFGSRNKDTEAFTDEKVRLYREICQAHQDWEAAQAKIHYVKEAEQIDYVIFLQEAAEKRYVMLLRQAKRMNMNVLELYQGTGRHTGKQKQSPPAGKTMEG